MKNNKLEFLFKAFTALSSTHWHFIYHSFFASPVLIRPTPYNYFVNNKKTN